ncbi:GspE/PulE family protein [Microvirga sp. 2YAF29]|uniref:GspE/PulE family protein n=1 Tax=Microvirga sp. 2YAF29 TaxID=3233031 RepID=UPI003F975F1D
MDALTASETGAAIARQDSSAIVQSVIDLLIENGSLTPQSLTRGRRASEQNHERLDAVLNKLGLVTDHALTSAWASTTGLPVAEATDYPAEPILRDSLASSFLAHARVLPLASKGDELDLAVIDALDVFTPAAIAAKTGLKVTRRLARPGEFNAAFERLYGRANAAPDDNGISGTDTALTLDIERLRDRASDAPVVRIANSLIDRAIELGASDLHISFSRSGLRIRYRIDGLLRDAEPPPAELHQALVSRIKIMAGLDIAERRLPQDGRIRIAWRGREIDLRVATMPHMNGEGVVLRVLDRSSVTLDFESLGFSQPHIASIDRILREPYGILLVTGPTGSGKTTTLYAALQAIATPDRNIITVEDPIEYQLDGINQIQVNRKIGLDFAGALRAVLRQDPDIIMVGEIRDQETAAVSNQAALTGHLVLATIHTNTAAAALPRLVDMGVEPYLLASTIRGTMAQRLVRKLCSHCRRKSALAPWQRHLYGGADIDACYEAMGCEACQGTGYAGRIAIAEIMTMTDGIRSRLIEKADESELSSLARQAGMVSMLEDGLKKAASGLTSIEEVLRVAGAS